MSVKIKLNLDIELSVNVRSLIENGDYGVEQILRSISQKDEAIIAELMEILNLGYLLEGQSNSVCRVEKVITPTLDNNFLSIESSGKTIYTNKPE